MVNNPVNLSIIIPAHNAAKSLPACLSSIAREAATDVQTIVIDDGSTDETINVVSLFSQLHPDFKLSYVHQSNQGVSVARNTGLRCSQGRFVTFVDSDDILEHGWYKAMSNYFHSEFDIISFRALAVKHGQRSVDFTIHNGELSSREVLFLYCSSYSLNSAWARLFSAHFLRLHALTFVPGVKVGEDALFMGELIKNGASFWQSECVVYVYQENLESVMHSHSDRMGDSSSVISKKCLLASELSNQEQRQSAAFLIHSFFSSFAASVHDKKFTIKNINHYVNYYWARSDMDVLCSRAESSLSERDRCYVRLVLNGQYRLLLIILMMESIVKQCR